MVKSPSGKVRTALGRLRGEAVKHEEKYKKILGQAPTPWDEETRISMQAVGALMEADLAKFDHQWQKWEEITEGITDEKYQKNVQLLDKFWNLWSKDYMNMLRERNQNEHKKVRGAVQRKPTVGEIVLVYEPDQPRNNWKAAKVNDVIQSYDGKTRSCEVQYMDGFITRRAINHLFPLEEGAANLSLSNDDPEEPIADH